MIRVSYESQVMVGRVAADPQNNPAVRGYWTDHYLGGHTGGLEKRARA